MSMAKMCPDRLLQAGCTTSCCIEHKDHPAASCARGTCSSVEVRQGGYSTCQPIERSFGGQMSWCTYCQMDVDAGRKKATTELRTVGRAKFPNDLSISRTNDKHSRVVAFPRVDHGVRKVLSHSKLTRFLQSTPGRMCHSFYQRL